MPSPATQQASIRSRTGSPVQRIILELDGGFRFRPGQYLEILHPDGPVPLSIASAPWRLPELHLHYRSTPGVAEAARMDELLALGRPLEIRGPAGDVTLPDPLPGPALLVAGGTGLAQALSFIDAFERQPPEAPVTLLWCADEASDLYLQAELESLAYDWLRVVCMADARRDTDNAALRWLRAHGAAASGGTANPGPIVLAGGPAFVYAASDALESAGVAPARLQSDVFSYAPRGAP